MSVAAQSPEDRARRREAREARRAKQRLENVVRSKQMHTARVSGGFSPPQISAAIATRFTRKFHIGCSGWYYWHWKGSFYPNELPSSRWFDHYAKKFRSVELNAPFYSWPTLSTVNS